MDQSPVAGTSTRNWLASLRLATLAGVGAVLISATAPVVGLANGSKPSAQLAEPSPILVQRGGVCSYGIFFDTKKHPVEEVVELMRLSDGQLSGSYLEIGLGVPSPRYLSGEALDAALRRREVALQAFEARIKAHRPPSSLDPVVRMIRGFIEANLWLGRRAQEYCVTDDAQALKQRYPGTGRGASCDHMLEALPRDRFGRCMAASIEWRNCMVRDGNVGLVPYPKKAWEAFLGEYGITLKILECDVP